MNGRRVRIVLRTKCTMTSCCILRRFASMALVFLFCMTGPACNSDKTSDRCQTYQLELSAAKLQLAETKLKLMRENSKLTKAQATVSRLSKRIDEVLAKTKPAPLPKSDSEKIRPTEQKPKRINRNSKRIIKTFRGTGIRSTRPFRVGPGWEIRWKHKGGIFTIFLHTKSGKMVDVAANQMKPGRGSSYQPKGGSYYMQVNATGSWQIQVVKLP